jgi:ABC-2 type transport system permease protein
MSGLSNILKKELKELMTVQTFLPIILIALIFGSMGSSISGIQEQAKTPPTIGVITEDTGTLATMATNVFHTYGHVVYNGTAATDKDTALATLTEKNGAALLIIPQNFTTNIQHNKPGTIEVYWIMKGAGLLDSIPSSAVEYLIATANTNISRHLISSNSSVNATVVLQPTTRIDSTTFKGREFTGLSPNTITGMLSSQALLIPIVMMMIIIMAGSIVITSMALEKENKTLETLLTLPVKRTSIVTGKIAAAAIIGLMLAVIYMIGMSFYLNGLTSSGGVNLATYGLALQPTDFLLIGLSLFVTLVAGLALCMLLGTFAKNFKSAQTLTFPITMLALIPMFLTMFADFDTLPLGLKALTFAIPFSHPMMAPRLLLFHDYTLLAAGLIYVTVFAILTISIVVWIFKTDRLLTGSTSKWAKLLSRRRRRPF